MTLLLPGMFEFAAPPRTGVQWFVQACQGVGLMIFPDMSSVETSFYIPWTKHSTSRRDLIRVSLVRHPCDWLRSIYDAFQSDLRLPYLTNRIIVRLGTELPRDDFGKYVTGYLAKMPGEITRIFDSYKVDTRLRLEDMPWALVELLESLGVEQKGLDRVIALRPQAKTPIPMRSKWRSDLRQQVLETEAKLCEDLDYY